MIANALLATLLLACHSVPALEIENLEPSYDSINDVHFYLKNNSHDTLWLDSFLLGRVVPERKHPDTLEWEVGSSWSCANAGAGGPKPIQPGERREVRLGEEWAFSNDDEPPQFETEDGSFRPIPGLYRFTIRYSPTEWSDLFHIPDRSQIVRIESKEFVVNETDN